ncbi:TonB family protein [Pontibacter sp. BT310]|uniref:Energy transducer TonB n=1 Tax=Pontibacter populi TaxID=890055 RepID=A0ABS6XAF7_9BACT|nr:MULTISPECIES: energy transducer TonB [Pontibacter]MBJ6118120.1 TonB family protein [Pontibacter sp. BT310]MBR0570547.1 TonB family protein [Microvirga sp. STS03]MBW3364973.1 energy transducer TonB [Pontibacter populi]
MNYTFTKGLVCALLLQVGVGVLTETTAQQAPDKVYSKVDQKPALLGGTQAVNPYFERALADVNRGQGGIITLNLVIGKTGQVTEATIGETFIPQEQRQLETNKALEQEIIKAALAMPGWKPGQQGGQPVAVQVSVPVTIASKEVLPPVERPYEYVEQMPDFPGGQPAMEKYLAANLKYPKDALDKKVAGVVVIKFVVGKAGELTDFKILKSLSESTDAEAIRVFESMPAWNPGKQNGRVVRVNYALPVFFKLPK